MSDSMMFLYGAASQIVNQQAVETSRLAGRPPVPPQRRAGFDFAPDRERRAGILTRHVDYLAAGYTTETVKPPPAQPGHGSVNAAPDTPES